MKETNVSVLRHYVEKYGIEMGENYPFKLARLADSQDDLSRRWFVSYYIWSQEKKKLIKKRIEITGDTLTERRAKAKEIIAQINHLLKNGAYTDPVSVEQVIKEAKTTADKVELLTVEAAVEKGLAIICAPLEVRSAETYRSNANAFLYFAEKIGITEKKLTVITRDIAFQFSDYLIVDKKLSKKTHNKYTSFMHTLFVTLINRGYAKHNPFEKIPKFKTSSKQHIPFLADQIKEVVDYLKNNPNPQLWLFINFIYYTFSRPHQEIRLLRIKDIKEKTIVIKPEDSKNDDILHKRIPPPLEALLQAENIRSYPSHYYVFSRNGKPGPTPMGDNYFYMQHRKILTALKFPEGYDLYGWKHTGVISFYLATRDIKRTQEQCGHKSLAQTDEYLRDLGLYAAFENYDDFPPLSV